MPALIGGSSTTALIPELGKINITITTGKGVFLNSNHKIVCFYFQVVFFGHFVDLFLLINVFGWMTPIPIESHFQSGHTSRKFFKLKSSLWTRFQQLNYGLDFNSSTMDKISTAPTKNVFPTTNKTFYIRIQIFNHSYWQIISHFLGFRLPKHLVLRCCPLWC